MLPIKVEGTKPSASAWDTFIANPLVSTSGAYIKAGALIEREEQAAQKACGLYFEIYEVRVLGALRGLATKLSPDDRKVLEQAAAERGHPLDDASYEAAQKSYEECMADVQHDQGADVGGVEDDWLIEHEDDSESLAEVAESSVDDSPEPVWEYESQKAAALEGWVIAETPDSEHGQYQVLKIDDANAYAVTHGYEVPQLETDEQAWRLMLGGDQPHHRMAQDFMEENNRAMWDQMCDFYISHMCTHQAKPSGMGM